MKRIVLWLMSTLTGLVLLFGYHTSTGGATPLASQVAPITASRGSDATSSTSTTSSGSGSGSGDGSSSPPSPSSRTVSGQVAFTQWGPVQVQLTVVDGSISSVSVVQYPYGNSRDEQINHYALPILIRETLDAQNASIDMVSGATVTSTGYLQSLQSALDQV